MCQHFNVTSVTAGSLFFSVGNKMLQDLQKPFISLLHHKYQSNYVVFVPSKIHISTQ